MITEVQSVTADELLRMPDDGFRYELVKGALRQLSPAGSRHGRIIMNVAVPLGQYVMVHNLGVVYAAETGFQLASNPDTVRAADVAFVRRERFEEIGDTERFWPGAPDLVVEVISPNDTYTEVEEKVFDWLEAGARMVLVLNPRKRTVTVYRSFSDIRVLQEGEFVDGGDVVPGWTIPVSQLFE